MARRPSLAHLGALLAALAVVPRARAQGTYTPVPFPHPEDELDEVDDLPDSDPSRPAGEDTESGRELEADTLGLHDDEIRGPLRYGVRLVVGTGLPWEFYSFGFDAVTSPEGVFGTFAGLGRYEGTGNFQEKAYDLNFDARSVGASYTHHFVRLEGLTISALAGYVDFSGRVTPHGTTDDADPAFDPAAEDALTTSFSSRGVFVGSAAGLTWLWTNGWHVDWTLVGVRKTFLFGTDYSRDSATARRAVSRDIAQPAFYGLTNIGVGLYF
jgi:hypothetical protein